MIKEVLNPKSTSKLSPTALKSSISTTAPVITPAQPTWLVSLIAPLFVTVIGIIFLTANHLSMNSIIEETATSIVALKTERTQRRVDKIFKQSEQVLNSMKILFPSPQKLTYESQLASDFIEIAKNHPGTSSIDWISATGEGMSFVVDSKMEKYFVCTELEPDGHFQSKSGKITKDGLQEVEKQSDPSIDGRKKSFYQEAVKVKKIFWGKPQVNNQEGFLISCVEPQFRDNELLGVMSVTYNMNSIETIIDELNKTDPGLRVLFSGNLELVYVPKNWIPPTIPTNRVMTASDLREKTAGDFFNLLPTLQKSLGNKQLQWLNTEPESYSVSLEKFQMPLEGDWYLGVLIPRSLLVGELDFHQNIGYLSGFILIVVAIIFGIWKTRMLAHIGNAVQRANLRAQRAEARAKELGAYDLIRLLGKGTMGEVWLAQHRMLARPAAIKLIKSETLDGGNEEIREEIRKRFTFEARITATLRSRHTIELYDYGVAQDGTYYYVMERLDGIDLKQMVTRFGPVPAARVVNFLIMICHSLAEAHDRGLVHRDIKPENIFICRRADEVDLIKVLDFGIVRINSQHPDAVVSRVGEVKGSPSTMSPEQITNQQLDGRSDLYSLGCVAYWLLTGKHVFESDNYVEMLSNHIQADPPTLRGRTTNYIPLELNAFVRRLLAKNREDRPRNAHICAEILREMDLGQAEPWTINQQREWWSKHVPLPKDLPNENQATQQFVLANVIK